MKRSCAYLIVFVSALLGAISCSTDKEDSPSAIAVSSLGFSGIDPDQGAVTLSVGDSLKLVVAIVPSNATNKNVSWASGSPEVAEVGQDGMVRALATGETTLTVRADDGSQVEASIALRVLDTENAITSFTIVGHEGYRTEIYADSITVTFPAGSDVDLGKLTPVIVHTGKSIAPASGVEQDFTDPVEYMVTAENGETKTYMVSIDVALTAAESDRAALMAIYDANPDSQTILTDWGWGSESPLNEWFGVETNAEGRVIELDAYDDDDEGGASLNVLPHEIGDLTALRTLYLGYNQLTEIPESIGKLAALQELYLNSNQLTEIPESIGDLTALERLYLSYNQLTEIPSSIDKLTALRTLNLSFNELTEIPDWIGDLTALVSLGLHHNQFTEIPDSIGDLTALNNLFLENNLLTEIPDSIGKLTGLNGLYLFNNQLTEIPESIGKLTALSYLWLDNNPLTSIPSSVCELGSSMGSGFRIDEGLCE
ncbi:leucine-rich repeat domain-containing protein [Allomuricauda taeanensis]|uniref:leucine-rich repeat domain-containing protein n=1 Tax=Flagellimonas taeanensis TaxID=1005926 RepID=UPI002E7B7EAA|nr:leucine-rich repeat domain-containing protein [Allomuricauda taeanensis]MEE1964621.1 leucine-rich repeat domain-containing protein [Allomuricauda taeanensis]